MLLINHIRIQIMEYPVFGERKIFRSFELFPHLTVIDNITLAPVKVQKRDKAEVRTEAESSHCTSTLHASEDRQSINRR